MLHGRAARGDRRRLAVFRARIAGKSATGRRLTDADYQDILGRLQTRCGYAPAQARAVTLHEYFDLAAYWSRELPADVTLEILARLWGWKPPEPPAPEISFADAVKAQGDLFRNPKRFFKDWHTPKR